MGDDDGERRRARTRCLEDLGRALSDAGPNLEVVLDLVTERLATHVGDGCAVMLNSEDSAWLEAADVCHRSPQLSASFKDTLPLLRQRPGVGAFGELVNSGRPVHLLPADLVGRYRELSMGSEVVEAFMHAHPPSSVLVAPMVVRGDAIGALVVTRNEPQPPHTADDLDLVSAVAARAAFAIADARRESELRAREARLRLVTNRAPDIVYRYDLRARRLEHVSSSVERVTGFSAEYLYRQPGSLDWLLHPSERHTLDDMFARIERSEPASFVHRLVRADGREIWLENRVMPLWDEHGLSGFEGIARDVTELKEAQDELAHRALHDLLTGLPNRQFFTEALELELRRLGRKPGAVAVLFLDLDRFKVVNDSLGHQVGDDLLVAVTDRLRHTVRPGDVLARLGGDEFAVLIAGPDAIETASGIAERILERLQAPFELRGQEVFTTGSIGIAVVEGSTDADDVLRHADAAMYRAKAAGRDRTEVFDDSLREATRSRLRVESDLRRALDRGELQIVYQPIVDSTSGRTVATEALLRWQRQDRLLGALEFIGLAEETGLIVPIGRWVLEQAHEQNRAWNATRPPDNHIAIHVNLSARQLTDARTARDLVALVEQLADGDLCLEITESVLMSSRAVDHHPLHSLKEAGARLAIDDFGTGYSSLAYLRCMPIDTVKIDRSFVDDVRRQPGDTAIITAITDLAHTLDLGVIAEGVETEGQLATLQRLGCEQAQGFLVAQPQPAEDITRRLASAV